MEAGSVGIPTQERGNEKNSPLQCDDVGQRGAFARPTAIFRTTG